MPNETQEPRTAEPARIVAGIFHGGRAFGKALTELRWSLRQNPEFWRQATLFCDPASQRELKGFEAAFGEVVVDADIPDHVLAHKVWNCKGWWAAKALERYPRILYCDFDIFVLRQPDAVLDSFLTRSPMLLYMPGYASPKKAVGCGVAYYERETPGFDRFLELLYSKWHHDEFAWTEVLGVTRESMAVSELQLSPFIVDHTWTRENPGRRSEPYIIHGISGIDDGYHRMRSLGYTRAHPFEMGPREWAQHFRHEFFRGVNRFRKSRPAPPQS